MLLENTFKNRKYIFCFWVGAYVASVLWITLLSRIGSEYRAFLFPFYSYREILKGSKQFLLENIGNVVLFVPLGAILSCIGVNAFKRTILIGFSSSITIELLQTIFSLGMFECDDIMHNTLGALLGFMLVKRFVRNFRIKMNRKSVVLVLVSIILCVLVPVGYQKIEYQKMVKLAASHDRDEKTKNLLVLNGKNGNVWNTNVFVKYLSDGSIHIKGTADKQSWWPIGSVTLEPGCYSFSGLSDTKENTVGLELEAYNQRFAPDVGAANEEVKFTLTKTTEIMVYVIVYEDCDCDVIATPVLYREE